MIREIKDHIVEGDLPQNQLTIQVMDEPGAGGANHHYEIVVPSPNGNDTHYLIHFQNGPINEVGLNGITQEILLAIVIDRLRSFQAGPFPCDANALALNYATMALECLKNRTRERLTRGVEGQTKK